MLTDVTSLHRALLDSEPKSFVSHYILEPIPFAFDNDFAGWIEWKRQIGDAIGVDPKDIVVIGSAAVGFSLNPFKSFKPFDARSDIDCGIVSAYHFDVAWRYLRQLRVSWLTLPSKTKEAILSHRKRHVFEGTIAADYILSLLPFGQEWQRALDVVRQVAPANGREVKLRIYKDFDSLRYYQARGIEKLREQLVEESDVAVDEIDGSMEIGTED